MFGNYYHKVAMPVFFVLNNLINYEIKIWATKLRREKKITKSQNIIRRVLKLLVS